MIKTHFCKILVSKLRSPETYVVCETPRMLICRYLALYSISNICVGTLCCLKLNTVDPALKTNRVFLGGSVFNAGKCL